MYTVKVEIQGIAPLLQHKFPIPELSALSKGGKKSTGAIDYTQEWRDYFYATPEGHIYQPAAHIEAAMAKSATNFKIAGKRGKTYKELFQSSVFVQPDYILHGMDVPDGLDEFSSKPLYLDVRSVVVNRARVVRIRPAFGPGWKLAFEIQVLDNEIQPELLNDVLVYAGRMVGIGDFRPRFGRFLVVLFAVHNTEVVV